MDDRAREIIARIRERHGGNGGLVHRRVSVSGGIPLLGPSPQLFAPYEEEERRQRRIASDAVSGVIEAIPRWERTYDQQKALELHQKAIEKRNAQQREERQQILAKRQEQSEKQRNPYRYWREEAAALEKKAYDRNIPWEERDTARKAYERMWVNSDKLDAMARRIDAQRDPAAQIAERDARQRREWENEILAAGDRGELSDTDPRVQSVRRSRLESALNGLGMETAPELPVRQRQGAGNAGSGGPTVNRGLPMPSSPAQGGAIQAPRVPATNTTTAPTVGPGVGAPQAASPVQTTERSYTPLEAVMDAFKGNPVDTRSLSQTIGRVYEKPLMQGVAQGGANAMIHVANAVRGLPEILKPDVASARSGVDWAVNRPQTTQAAPEVQSALRGIGTAAKTIGMFGQNILNPAPSALGWGLGQYLPSAIKPVVDVASQIGHNFSQSVQGLPTYGQPDDQQQRRAAR